MTVEGLGKRSLQGDVGFADVLHQMGAELVFGPDFITVRGHRTRSKASRSTCSTCPTRRRRWRSSALFAEGETSIRGLHTLRVKETDRLAALATELEKLGAEVEVGGRLPGDHAAGDA